MADPWGLDADTKVVSDSVPAPAAQAPGLRPFDLLGSYQVLRRLGGGGMAEVYLARSSLMGGVEKLVALKIALPAFGPDTPLGSMFLNEARVSASLQHPNIIQVFDFGEAAGRPYLAMEYIRGRDLGALMVRALLEGRRLPVAFAVTVVEAVLRALEYLHHRKGLDGASLQLVHRDVSPANVLVSVEGEVKLTDFGVVAGAQPGAVEQVAGKQRYVPPEGGEPQPGWDVFALGLVLRQLLTLEPLVTQPSVPPSALNPDVTLALDRVVMTATSRDPALRFPSAQAMREALAQAVPAEQRSFEVGPAVLGLCADELSADEREAERLIAQGRTRTPRTRAPLSALRPFRALRRRLAASRLAMAAARHRRGVRIGLLLGLLGLTAGAYLALGSWQREAAVSAAVEIADERILAGRLVGPGGDHALDHLLRARRLGADDARVAARMRLLADRLERLGERAASRGDLAEAVVHLEAVVLADATRTEVRIRIRELEDALRQRARVGSRRSP